MVRRVWTASRQGQYSSAEWNDYGSKHRAENIHPCLKVNLFDLFLAGSETTSTTLTWAVLYMVRYPGVQARVQQELDSVVGINR